MRRIDCCRRTAACVSGVNGYETRDGSYQLLDVSEWTEASLSAEGTSTGL